MSGSSAFTVAGGAFLDLGGFDQTIGSLAGSGTVTNSGVASPATLTGGGDNTSTLFSGIIQNGTSTTALTKAGSGTLTLSGANTYTGGTTISAGTLQIGNGGTSGSLTGNVTNNGIFAFNRTDTVTFDGNISGTGAFQQNGTGTTILSGTNTYSGATAVNAGTLAGGATNALSGSSAFTVAGGAFLDLGGFDQTIGSLAGSGTVTNSGVASPATLTGGGDNTSTLFSGIIQNGTSTTALTKAGSGTLTLSGANTYTGGTTISAGTLQIGNGGTSGSLTGNVTNNGIFAFNRTDTVTFDGNISGTGAFQQNGTGTTILSGTNTYSGATAVNAGTLAGGATNALSGSSAFTVAGGAFLDLGGFDQTIGSLAGSGTVTNSGVASPATLTGGGDNTSTLFSGIIQNGTSTTALTKAGSGTLTLSGANTYTGGTTISAGTLQIGNGGTAGSILGNVLDNGVLAFNRSDAIAFSGLISGTGILRQIGTGALILPNANTYTGGTLILGGTVAIGNDTPLGSGPVSMFDGATLAFTQNGINLPNPISLGVFAGTFDTGSFTETLSGVISGPSDLTKVGSGTLILAANNTYTGPTNVNAGVLDVAGSIASSSLTTIANGAALTGTGSLGALQVNSGGIFAPGTVGSPGTFMTLSGNLTFQSGSIYDIFLNPTTTSYINVSGSASLAGTVVASFLNGSYISKLYTILSAGNVSGTFDTLNTNNLPSNFTASLKYDGGHAYLDLMLNFAPQPDGAELHAAHGQREQRRQHAGELFQHHRRHPDGVRRLDAGGLDANRRGKRNRRRARRVQFDGSISRADARPLRRRQKRRRLDGGRRCTGFCPGSAGGPRARYGARLCRTAQCAAEARLRAALERLGRRLWRHRHGNRRCGHRFDDADCNRLRLCRRAGLSRHAGQRDRLCACRRRHPLGIGPGAWQRPERCVPGRRLRRDARRPDLSLCRVRRRQSLDVDRPDRVGRRAQCKLQRAELWRPH